MHFLDSPDALFFANSFVFGLLIGSFLNVLIYRIPIAMQLTNSDLQEKSHYLTGNKARSQCRHCGYQLRWYHNIPLVSYVALRGRCSNCRVRISVQYPAVELLVATGFLFAAMHFGINKPMMAVIVFFSVAIPLIAIDLRYYILPDKLVFTLLVFGLVFSATGFTEQSLSSAALGVASGFLGVWLLSLMYRVIRKRDGLGFGDVKLMGAIGAWLGALGVIEAFYIGAVFGLVVAPLTLIKRFRRFGNASMMIPFGPALLLAALIVLIAQYHDVSFIDYLRRQIM